MLNRHVQCLVGITLAVASVFGLKSTAADSTEQREDQLRAAYLFNFVKFISWPATAADGPLTICFLGAAGVFERFAAGIESKRAGAHPLAVRQIEDSTQLSGCNVMYVDKNRSAGLQPIANTSKSQLLTVGETKEFTRNGGVIELFTDSNRLRFNINIGNAKRAGLQISSNLLQLAASVESQESK